MGVKFHYDKLRTSRHVLGFVFDLFMLLLISVNLAWLIFDSLFASLAIQQLLASLSPEFYQFYAQKVHPDFVLYDLFFVAVYALEIIVSWIISIARKDYHRWWFYPFVHWYDVLGSIPVSSFRVLRLLRIVSLIYRLQKYNVLDFADTPIARFIRKYFYVLVEEVSDRVVINVLEGLQQEIRSGNPIGIKLLKEVVAPRKQLLAQWLGDRLTDLVEQSYHPRQEQVARYVHKLIAEAIAQSPGLYPLDRLPMLGGLLHGRLETVVSDVTYEVVHQLFLDLHGDESTSLIHEVTNVFFDAISEPGGDLNLWVKEVLLEAIELIKEEVAIQKWKLV